MNRILIKFLISFLLFNFIHPSDDFENWLKDNENKVFHEGGTSKVTFNIKLNTLDHQNTQQSDSCYILLDILNNIFQIKIFDNIIYHDEFSTIQYSLFSNQLFRYDEDRVVSSLIKMIVSKDFFFNFSKYEYDSQTNRYSFKLNNNTLNFLLLNNQVSIDYKDSAYSINIDDLKIEKLIKEEYDRLLLYNANDTTNIEIFDFRD